MVNETATTSQPHNEHSAGPWRDTEHEDIDGPSGDHVIWPSGSGFVVARVFNTPAQNVEANARLIAAAPDLLVALTKVIGFAEEFRASFEAEAAVPGGSITADFFFQAMTEAYDAIAKARGRS